MAATLATPVAQAVATLFDGTLGKLLNYGLSVGKGLLGAFSPLSLFGNAEQGVWYDPSDFSTMFQDSAGTTPVTAVEQPVGLILDKSKGLVLGPELVTNGTFDSDTGWTLVNSTITDGKLVCSSAVSAALASRSLPFVGGRTYELTLVLSSRTSGAVIVVYGVGVNVSSLGPTTVPGTYRTRVAAGAGNSELRISCGADGFFGEVESISVRELPGNHATQATAASRPVLKQDANGKYYLKFDGVDDSLATASINFTSTDKMTVFAGVRKLSDALAYQIITELSARTDDNNGSFALLGPDVAEPNYLSALRGTQLTKQTLKTYAAPISSVISLAMDISQATSATELKNRVNGVVPASVVVGGSANAGTGNFGNYPLYIGRRGGTTLPFNGHLYSLIVRGAQSTDSQIVNAENYVNSKTGAF